MTLIVSPDAQILPFPAEQPSVELSEEDKALLSPQSDSEIDPVVDVTNLLITNGHPDPTGWLQFVHHDALLDSTPVDVRRFLVNRHWRRVVGMCTDTTTDNDNVRYCMVDDGPLTDWLMLYRQSVVPFIVKNKLVN